MLFTYQTKETCPDQYKLDNGACQSGKAETEVDDDRVYGDTGFENFVKDYGIDIMGIINLLLLIWLVIIHFVNWTLLKIIMAIDDLQYEGSRKGKKQHKIVYIYIYI